MKHDHKDFEPGECDPRRSMGRPGLAQRLRDYWRDNRDHAGQLYVPAHAKAWWVP